MPILLRLAALPARSLIAALSAALIAPVVLASVPALLVTSFTADGPGRWKTLIGQITAWTHTVLSTAPQLTSSMPRQRTRRPAAPAGRARTAAGERRR
ncbi:hypothetical protein [Streptomyces sp. PsTaAH-124]|uniref:hypothetical protein n=1 Tax=Streptomyces sp. PsTaAH-124 TaxID=1157638 RepID=UPI00035E7B7A|nr:hypothetical protein [Streptomyces sp. PsTaAH-124]